MTVAFYAPLKHPDHHVPSGDRAMARAMLKALHASGHSVQMASTLRSFLATPEPDRMAVLTAKAAREIEDITLHWQTLSEADKPSLWFTYHNYHKAPDLIGPALSRRFGLPYVLAEASHAPRRAAEWGVWYAAATAASLQADMHFCLTTRDRSGVSSIVGVEVPIVELPPFIDADWLPANGTVFRPGPTQLLTIAMMRPGDKLSSYGFLAQALALLTDLDWHLTIVGDGPARAEVTAAFATCPADRLTWQGELPRDGIAKALGCADIFVWPGFGEAFGVAYLEAQASGLPVVALDVAGVASVVRNRQTGFLVSEPVPARYADALRLLMTETAERLQMGRAAADFVRSERNITRSAEIIGKALARLVSQNLPLVP